MSAKQIIQTLMQVLDCKNQKELAKKIGRNPAYLSQTIARDRLTPKIIDYICAKFPFVSREYLMTGKGEPTIPKIDPAQQARDRLVSMVVENFRLLTPEVQEVLLEAYRKIDKR